MFGSLRHNSAASVVSRQGMRTSAKAALRNGLATSASTSSTSTCMVETASSTPCGATDSWSEGASSQALAPRQGEVYYFAYGSNMNPKVLTGRRMVTPRASYPCSLDGYTLAFNYLGIPYAEPGFAIILPDRPRQAERAGTQAGHNEGASNQAGLQPVGTSSNGGSNSTGTSSSGRGNGGSSSSSSSSNSAAAAGHAARQVAGLHGVVHLITDADWNKIKQSEGVSGQSVGYQVVSVKCTLYDGQWVMAETLEAAPVSLGDPSAVLPSQRYIQILREGARHHGVAPAYCEMLDAQPCYVVDGWRPKVGKLMCGAFALLLLLPLGPLLLSLTALSWVKRALGMVTPSHSLSSNEGSGHVPQVTCTATATGTATASVTTTTGEGSKPGEAVVFAAAGAQPATAGSNKAAKAMASMHPSMGHPFVALYVAGVFRAAWGLHGVLRHVLGDGKDMTLAAAALQHAKCGTIAHSKSKAE